MDGNINSENFSGFSLKFNYLPFFTNLRCQEESQLCQWFAINSGKTQTLLWYYSIFPAKTSMHKWL